MSTKKQAKNDEKAAEAEWHPRERDIRSVGIEFRWGVSVQEEFRNKNEMWGDTLVHVGVEGGRADVAEEMRAIAHTVANTLGDKVESAEIVVLLRRAPRVLG